MAPVHNVQQPCCLNRARLLSGLQCQPCLEQPVLNNRLSGTKTFAIKTISTMYTLQIYAALFTPDTNTVMSFFAQQDHMQVFKFVFDCLDFLKL